MKIFNKHIALRGLVCLLFLIMGYDSFGQGRVVVNEIMPWSGCNTTSEFIELLNFGPGPMNIGCYIITNGKYSVTIPPNTIINTGQYYVLSGQDTLAKNCGNKDSTVHVNLNWTSCNCSNIPIPVTGDGFMQNGGSANEKIVLLDPNLNVVDAVSRNSTPSSSTLITSAAVTGGCGAKTFNLDSMHIGYESINSSTGIDNSFARKVDGDCGWVKTTVISANAPNKTGSSSSATYDFSTLSASECSGTTGSISISVTASNVSALFPMNYTLAFDKDSNNVFSTNDTYTYGVDSSAPDINISKLLYGRYRITVGSSMGCNLKSFDFFIFNCYGVPLPVKLIYFKYRGVSQDQLVFACRMGEPESLKTLVLEGSNDGGLYQPVTTVNAPIGNGELIIKAPLPGYRNYRLRMVDRLGVVSYSPVIQTNLVVANLRYGPNPVENKLIVQLPASASGSLSYSICNATGTVLKQEVPPAASTLIVDTGSLRPGIYYMQINGTTLPKPLSLRFVK